MRHTVGMKIIRGLSAISAYLLVFMTACAWWGSTTCSVGTCGALFGVLVLALLFVPGAMIAPFVWFIRKVQPTRDLSYYLTSVVVLISTSIILCITGYLSWWILFTPEGSDFWRALMRYGIS